ncbi:addiction module protein [Methylibium sp.]|uniref:addiction module protein n=1 Tax=Methylibium sp. TaxID=2067992 RepID=UPI0025EA4070|nr:addiction module protein [Methylibium sp.]
MNPNVEDIAAQASRLSADDRERLLERILASLVESDPDVDAAWNAEIERRVDAIESGEMRAIPWDEVKKDLGL